jgi:hypothetical protein
VAIWEWKPRVRACSTRVSAPGGPAGDQLLLVQPQPALVVVDQECGDAQVGLQQVVVDRVGIGQGERAAEGLRGGRPVLAATRTSPWAWLCCYSLPLSCGRPGCRSRSSP